MKLLHVADLHFCRERADECLLSLRVLLSYVERKQVQGVLVSGDIFDAAIVNSENTRLPELVSILVKINAIAPIFLIEGTPSHDVDGSLKILESAGLRIINGVQAFELANGEKLIVAGIPEPRRKNILPFLPEGAGRGDTDKAMREALSLYSLQLAGRVKELKEEHGNIVTVLMYHGEIAGTKFRKNADSISRGTGIALYTEQLMSVGADYVACGHLHEPQQVGTYPIYYAGSIYPKDFGETHDAGFNVVDFELKGTKYDINVTRESFGQVNNRKFTTLEWKPEAVKGKRVWISLKDKEVNIDEETEKLLAVGAIQGSKVTVEFSPVETVRAQEITEKEKAVDKLEVYADASGEKEKVTDSIKAKVEELEAIVQHNLLATKGVWTLKSVRLRGSIGIRKGIGKAEVFIDFSNFEDGLIALMGDNGEGKTTLVENCHPYPQQFTRNQKLQDLFELKDSLREVIYQNENNGELLKLVIQIDGVIKSYAPKYYAFTGDGENWKEVSGVDGNLKPYNDFITQKFGDVSIFLRTAFIPQKAVKNVPDLTLATKGEKKALLAELSGISYLQDIADLAKENGDACEKENISLSGKKDVLESVINDSDRVKEQLEEAKKKLKEIILKPFEDKVSKLRTEISELEKVKTETEAKKEKIATIRESIESVEEKKTATERRIVQLKQSLSEESASVQKVTEFERLQVELTAEKDALQKHTQKQQDALKLYTEENRVYTGKVNAITAEINRIELEVKDLSSKQSLLQQSITNLNEKYGEPIVDTCPTCKQKLPEVELNLLQHEREKIRMQIVAKEKDLAENNEAQKAQNTALQTQKKALDDLVWDEPVKPEEEPFDDSAMKSIQSKLQAIDIEHHKGIVQQAKTAKEMLIELEEKVKLQRDEIVNQEAEIQKLTGELKEFDSLTYAQKMQEKNQAEINLDEKKSEKVRLETLIETSTRQLGEVDKKRKELAEIITTFEDNQKAAEEWAYIKRAFGPDGIQALELDAISPETAEIANRILESAFGDRFKIFFETTRMGGSGTKVKQIEDFLIMIHDNKDGGTTLLENLSVGESVWIKKAIYDAFSIMKKRNTGSSFLTAIQDESDSALSDSSKSAYARMLEAAHNENKLKQTILISHSPAVLSMIPQKIVMKEL